MVKAQQGYPEPLKSVVVPIFSFYAPDTPEIPFDVAAATKLLDDAGYVLGSDGVRAKGDQRLSFKFVAQAGRADDELVQQIIIGQLKAIGIEAVADNKAGVAYREARYKGGYDLLYGRWITAADPVYSIFWGTGGPNNGQGYSNPTLDAAFKKFESELDPRRRKSMRPSSRRSSPRIFRPSRSPATPRRSPNRRGSRTSSPTRRT